MGKAHRRLVVPRLRAIVTIVLGAALAVSGGLVSPPAAAAGGTSDIPGIPLPGPTVVGQLGGDIYDVVFSLDVAPGSIILAILTGTAGTDFDLYLFDGSATTVVDNVGVVARSTGPSSTESIGYGAPAGGRYYIDLNSATAAMGTYTLAVQVVPNRPEVAALSLDGGRSSTNSTTVSVALAASGSLSSPAQMAFSSDGITWQPWQPYQAVTAWTFPDGDGVKTLWAKVKNSGGVDSPAVSDSIVLDTEPPTLASVDPPLGTDLPGPRPTITITFSKPIDPASWETWGLIVQTTGGTVVPGSLTVTGPDSGSYRPSADLVGGTTYIISLGAVRDLAGTMVPTGWWFATDRWAPQLAVAASPRVVDRGATSLLSGRLMAPTGVASLTLEALPAGALSAVPLGSVPVAPDGSFSSRVTPSSTTEYRVSVPAAGGFAAGSVSAVVAVRRAVRLNWSASTLHAGRVGARVSIVATASPPAAGVGVAFRLERWSAVSRSWGLVGTLSRRTDASGRARVAWVPSGSALYRWRAIAASTADYSTGASAWARWSIAR